PKLDGSLEALLGAVQTTVGKTIGAMAADFMTRLPAPAQAALGKLANLYGVPFDTSTSTVTVVLKPQSGRTSSASVAALSALGVSRTAIEASTSLIKVSVPLSQLSTIVSQLGGISFIRPPYTPYTLAITGEGIAAIGADAFHVAGITGSGVKVAIIDLGFAGLSQAQGRGDIPYSVQQHDLTGTGLTSGITHGTAIAEIVHEIAPGAQLHLIKIADEVDLDLAVTYCLNNGIDIINHSLGWYNTNFYDGTGTVAEIAKRSIAGGILWLNAAGNEAQSHWEGTFSDSNSDTWNDQSLTFSATSGSQVILYMTWNNWPQASSDYDLYLYDPSSNLVASSTKHQTGTEEPTESIMTTVSASGTYTVRVKGAGSKKIEIYNLYQYLAPAIAASSILAPGNVAEVVTVGAIDYAHYASGPLEPYSSQGPTNDGRTKPDVCAPDKITTGTIPYTSFAGTSGATPHATGAAALLLAQDPSLSESALRARLLSQTVAMGSSYLYGHGRLVLSPPSAANQPPTAAFNANPSSTTVGSSISFNASASSDPDGSIVSYAWQYGDGTTGFGVTAQHAYAAVGTYTVRLTVTDNDGATGTTTRQVGISAQPNQPPTAAFNANPSSTTVGSSISFNASASSDPDGWIVSYTWQFGDGTTGSGVTAQHSYAAAGTYTVRLTVTDNDGATDTTTRQVTVGQATPPLTIQLSLPKVSYQVGEPIVINYSTNREAYVYICDADPSGKVTLLFPSYLEPNNRIPAGTHSVPSGGYTLRVSAPEGSETLYAFAATSPLPNFPTSFGSGFRILSYNPSSFLSSVRQTMQAQLPAGEGAEDILSFTVVSSAPQTGTLWVTSSPQGAAVTIDGAPAGTTPIQVSVTAGTHTVTLSLAGYQTVTQQATVFAGQTAYVQVPMTPEMQNQPPGAVINLSSATPSIGETVFFDGSGSTDPDGWIVSYLWDFGDGTGASGVQATHAYAASGTYLVHLMVSDNQGLTHTTSRTVVISSSAPPPPWGGATGGEPPMGGTPGIFVWGTNTWHITVNAGAHWTSAHSYRLEF
ncbi:PKD domain-containing protein, partial [Candidatus Bipolaricaulota bacterium]|nr:PKD domain-containing protein [Candidatus Bipolaricaulota bacterium]